MSVNTINDNTYINGNLACKTFTPPSSCIRNSSIEASAGISASKLQHRFHKGHAQVHGSAATAERRVIHVVRGATATINSMRAGVVAAAVGDSTASVNLYKNGSSILAGGTPITLSSADADFALDSPGGFTSTALVQGDILEIVQTISAGSGTLPQGVHSVVEIDEDAA